MSHNRLIMTATLRPSTYAISKIEGSRRIFKVLTVAEVLNHLHRTYEAEGYAFLINNYRAEKTTINAQINGEILGLELTVLNDQIRIYFTYPHGKTFIFIITHLACLSLIRQEISSPYFPSN